MNVIAVLVALGLGIDPGPQQSASAASSIHPFSNPGAMLTNGTISLGLNPEGELIGGSPYTGLRFEATGADALIPGWPWEAWGVADSTTGAYGYANSYMGLFGIQLESFSLPTSDSATSTVKAANGLFRVTHAFHPVSAVPNLFQIDVTVTNISGAAVSAYYSRVMDWDIAPTAFNEDVTIQGATNPPVLFDSNDGFASGDPLAAPSDRGATGNFLLYGPEDQGARFDFTLGLLQPNQSRTFTLFYGAGPNKSAVLTALQTVGASIYSLALPSNDPTNGTPNTFAFGARFETPCPTPTQRCADLISFAHGLSQTTRSCRGSSALTQDQMTALFEAAECETGVPAKVLKAFAFNESLAKEYQESYPRQFVEPCAGERNLSGWSYPGDLFNRYYGKGVWPLIALGTPAGSAQPKGSPQFKVPNACTVPPPPNQADWAAIWPYVTHTTLGVDDKCTIGMGVMQLTFVNRDLLDAGSASPGNMFFGVADQCNDSAKQPYGALYPYGGNPTVNPGVFSLSRPLTLREAVQDPYVNILFTAQLVLYKYEWADAAANKVKPNAKQLVNQCVATTGERLLRRGDEAPPTTELASWWPIVGQAKTFASTRDLCNYCNLGNNCSAQAATQCYFQNALTAPTGSNACATDPAGMDCFFEKARTFVARPAPPTLPGPPTCN